MARFMILIFVFLPAFTLQDSTNNEADESGGSSYNEILPGYSNLVRWNRAFHDGVRSVVLSSTGHDLEQMMSRCYGQFGCFSIFGPWKNDLTRPVSLFPLPPESISPQYCLYTRRSPTTCEPLIINDPSSIYRSSYMPRGQVYIIAHGFVEHGERPWIQKMTEELLKRSSCNVIVIDWQKGANPPYTQAVANIRLIGVMTAHLINTLVHEVVGLKAEKVHVIGHSLGAHLASYIGTALRKSFGMRLGRISGLDPAEPHFAETDGIVRLDPSDAIFVDNIHTDAGGFTRLSLGMLAPVGHVDFYPNGGRNQPGCPKTILEHIERENGSFTGSVRNYLNCDHTRSYNYFIETINKKLPTLHAECTSYEEYLNGSCFSCENDEHGISRCVPMGFHSINAFLPHNFKRRLSSGDAMLTESPKGRVRKMYAITSASPPFYFNQYRVTITVSNETRDAGLFEINVIGEAGETGYLPLDRIKYLDGGSTQTAVVAGPSIGVPVNAVLRWTHQANFLFWRVNLPYIIVPLVTVEAIDHKRMLNLCAGAKLQSGYPGTLKPCDGR